MIDSQITPESGGTMQLQFATRELGRIHRGDCLEILNDIPDSSVDLVFADPPFNIGYEYDEYHDSQDDEEYVTWCTKWMSEIHRTLKPNGTFWLAIGDEFAAQLKVAAQKEVGFFSRSWVIWYYTFGVNCTKKFSRSHVHLLHFVKDENDFTFNAEDPMIRVPSARALVYADKRANPAGRLPDDTWMLRPAPDGNWVLRPQDLPHGFESMDDTWYYARIAGSFSERQGFHGCQMPEQLLGRIVRVSSNPGDVVLDPFAGSGTTLSVAKKLRRQWIGCEVSDQYVQEAMERLNAVQIGEPLIGPADAIESAPTTTRGRKLENLNLGNPIAAATADVHVSVDQGSASTTVSVSLSQKSKVATQRREVRDVIRDAIVAAFYATNDGHSTDWLLASPDLQANFHDACHDAGLIGSPLDWNRRLLRLRKSGHFPKEGELKKIHFSAIEMDNYGFAAEIAWRLTTERFRDASLDEILCDPEKADFFDRTAKRFAAHYNAAGCRWAALRLRKASKELVHEMKQFHFVVGSRDFPRRAINWQSCDFNRYGGKPGVYLLQDEEKNQLFLDRTLDLGGRLEQHYRSASSARRIGYVSMIPADELPAPDYQDALKVDLVRRYDPPLNVNIVRLFEAIAS
jgi:site-specific DNA-methyltransferase (adenine-specific)